MRNNHRLVRGAFGIALVLISVAWTGQAQAAPQSGITVTPAALTLSLAKGQHETSTSFDVTNNYRSAVSVGFAIEPSEAQGASLSADDVRQLVFLSQTAVTLESGQTIRQTVTLKDSVLLPPGSQALSLLVSQQSGAGGSVAIASRIQLPLSLTKEDGAVASLHIASLDTPGTLLTVPSSVRVTVRNTGNTTIIPRGYVVVSDPRGTVIAKGVLNSASLAVSPRASLTLQTTLARIANIRWPGPYKVTAFSGLGAGQGSEQRTAKIWFIAWWHIALAALTGVGLYYSRHFVQRLCGHKRRVKHRPSASHGLLAGRGSP